MTYYTVGEFTLVHSDWVSAYVRAVTALVEGFGGRYLARTPKVERLEGCRPVPGIFLIIEWPSKEAAEAFYRSEAYAPHLRNRLAGAINELSLIAGEDVTRLTAGSRDS